MERDAILKWQSRERIVAHLQALSSVAASPRQIDTVLVTRSAIGQRTLDFGTVL